VQVAIILENSNIVYRNPKEHDKTPVVSSKKGDMEEFRGRVKSS